MDNIKCKIRCLGTTKIGKEWKHNTSIGYNRLYYINGGKGEYVKKGVRIPFEKDKVYFIPFYANVFTYADSSDKLDHTYVDFYLTPPIISTEVFCLDTNESPYVKAAVDTFRVLCQTKELDTFEIELLKSVVIYLTGVAVRLTPDNMLRDKLVIDALDIIHSDISEKCTVASLAKKCNMSINGFIKKFEKHVGETPYSYIKKLKLSTALLLREGGATLTEAAEKCGYSDATALLHAIASEKTPQNKQR